MIKIINDWDVQIKKLIRWINNNKSLFYIPCGILVYYSADVKCNS